MARIIDETFNHTAHYIEHFIESCEGNPFFVDAGTIVDASEHQANINAGQAGRDLAEINRVRARKGLSEVSPRLVRVKARDSEVFVEAYEKQSQRY